MWKAAYWIALPAMLILLGCPAGPSESQEQNSPSEEAQADMPAAKIDEFEKFELAEGECRADATLTLDLGDGQDRSMKVLSAYAQPSIAITSQQGEIVTTRRGSAYTLNIADYAMDLDNPGLNPSEEQAKLEVVFITSDKSPIAPGIYRTTKKGNLAVGPNLFYGGRAYPMKDNFVGGAKITVVDDEKLCGEFCLKSRFGVRILGKFEAELIPPDE